MHPFVSFLHKQKIIILDGGMGSEIYRRGYKTKMPLWSGSANLDVPALIYQIHKDYVGAGADIITTNTFRTQPYAFAKAKLGKDVAHKATLAALNAAIRVREESSRSVFVGGGLTTLEDCYRPELVPLDEILREEHFYFADLLASNGVDFLFCETVGTIREGIILADACRSTNLPFMMSFIPDEQGRLLSGESLEQTVAAIRPFHPVAFLLNCRPPSLISSGVNELARVWDGIKGIYPNGEGRPDDAVGWEFEKNNSIEAFIRYMLQWRDAGYAILGGCCGTDPEYIRALTIRAKAAS